MLKISVAVAALVLCGASANAQNADIRQDQHTIRQDDSKVRTDDALAARDTARVAELRRRAMHETGARRRADLATAARIEAHDRTYQHRAGAEGAAAAATAQDMRSDMTHPPH